MKGSGYYLLACFVGLETVKDVTADLGKRQILDLGLTFYIVDLVHIYQSSFNLHNLTKLSKKTKWNSGTFDIARYKIKHRSRC
jgi:hypothetical protein